MVNSNYLNLYDFDRNSNGKILVTPKRQHGDKEDGFCIIVGNTTIYLTKAQTEAFLRLTKGK